MLELPNMEPPRPKDPEPPRPGPRSAEPPGLALPSSEPPSTPSRRLPPNRTLDAPTPDPSR